MIKIFFFLLGFFSLVINNESSDNKEEELPIIDLRKGLIFEKNINLEKYFNENKNSEFKILSQVEIDKIKLFAKEYINEPVHKDDIIIMITTHGTMKIKLFGDIAPENSSNFKKLANSGFYDGTSFHRVISGFIVQGGDILTRDADERNDGTGNPGWTVDAEFSNLKHKKGTLSMHRIKNDINSAGSQFFITLSKQEKLDNNYTIIGEIIDGITILDIIENVPSQSKIAFRMLKKNIPPNEDKNLWKEIDFNSKKYFIKIPSGVNSDDFEKIILDRIKNKTKPSVPIRIKEVRVVNNNQDVNN